jgi:sulfopyruvate decarboxylase TPP-binding subunit
MQNAGFANSISTITSLVQLYGIPLIFLIGWRGYLKKDAPEHMKIGKIQPNLLKILDLPSKIITDKNWKVSCNWALKKLANHESSALIIRRLFCD